MVLRRRPGLDVRSRISPVTARLTLFILTYRQASRQSRLCQFWRFLTRTWRALSTSRATSWVWRVSEAFQTWLSAPCSVQVSATAAALTWRSTWSCARCSCTSPHDLQSYLAANIDRWSQFVNSEEPYLTLSNIFQIYLLAPPTIIKSIHEITDT